jgi:membrane peptidoglycan carboxypeptidase
VGSQFDVPAGGKTGTTNDGADVWFIGYTSDLVAGVWMGLDRPRKIKGNAQGGILAAPAWAAFMREVYRRKPAARDWPRPEGVVVRQVELASGLLWAPGCGPAVSDYYVAGTDPAIACTPGAYVEPGMAGADSSFGFPIPGDTGVGGRVTRASPGGMIVPGAAPIPRASRSRSAADTLRVQRDTSNPFLLPSAPPR